MLPALASPPALALEPTDRFAVSIGGYANSLGLEGRFDGSTDVTGTRYDFSEGFQLDDREELTLLGIEWSPAPRHQLHATVFEDRRKRTAVIERDLVFEDATFPLAAEINGRFEVRAVDVGYTFWAWRTETTAWGVGVGVLDYRARLSLRGELRRGGEDEPLAEGEAAVTDRLRAPVLSAGWRWVASDALRFRADAYALQVGWDGIDGEIYGLRLGAEWFPLEHIGLSLGYSHTELRAEARREQLRGQLTMEFSGLQALALIRF